MWKWKVGVAFPGHVGTRLVWVGRVGRVGRVVWRTVEV